MIRITDHLPDRIRRAARSIALASWLRDPDAWANASIVMAAHLEARERAALAFAAFQSLTDEQQAVFLAHVHLHGRASS